MIKYCLTPSGNYGIRVNNDLVAWVHSRGSSILRFDVVDESPGPNWSESFETLGGADTRMHEIARREEARAENKRLRDAEVQRNW